MSIKGKDARGLVRRRGMSKPPEAFFYTLETVPQAPSNGAERAEKSMNIVVEATTLSDVVEAW